MAGFSLGGNLNPHEDHQIPPENLFLYGHNRNDDIATTYTKGFKLWQHHNPHIHHRQPIYPAAAAPGLGMFLDDSLGGAVAMASGSRSGRGGSAGGMSCQDCGNQAKKDCMHMRCRTCCKSRNFDCPTHVKSTWVPAAKRRERQRQLVAAMQQQQEENVQACGGGDASKRPREISNRLQVITPTTSNSGGMEAVRTFPPEVSSPAVFRCVRVSAVDDEDEQYAYQTAVNIGGHVFKGILYDQGPDAPYPSQQQGDCSTSPPPINIAATATATATSSAGMAVDPSFYPAPLSAFMASTQFFPHPRS